MTHSSASKKKNVVLISLDDAVAFWKYKNLLGAELLTPNLDRICEQSTAFHSAYCQAPVCSPSRASLMSAKSPHVTGVNGPAARYFEQIPADTMWPYKLKEDGYFCSSGGKVALAYGPLPPKIRSTLFSDERKRFKLEPRNRKFKDNKIPGRMKFGGFRGGLATFDDAGEQSLYDDQSTRSALNFIETYSGDAPFYREVGLIATHGPWTTPRRFKDMYDHEKFRKPPEWHTGFDPYEVMENISGLNYKIGRREHWQKSIRNYFAGISYVDYNIGRIWDAIKASPHADNTVIVILSDHGLHLGERKRFRKHTLWEQVANVPLIIHDPDQPDGQVVIDPVGLIDVGPTILDMAGLSALNDSQRQSLKPLMHGESNPDRAVPTFLFENAAIRKGRYRFIRYSDGSTQLFDLEADWWQTQDLGLDHAAYPEMQNAHVACCKEYGFDPTEGLVSP